MPNSGCHELITQADLRTIYRIRLEEHRLSAEFADRLRNGVTVEPGKFRACVVDGKLEVTECPEESSS